jgi:hypothetical protein
MYRLSPTEAPEAFDVIQGIYTGPPPPRAFASAAAVGDREGGVGGRQAAAPRRGQSSPGE